MNLFAGISEHINYGLRSLKSMKAKALKHNELGAIGKEVKIIAPGKDYTGRLSFEDIGKVPGTLGQRGYYLKCGDSMCQIPLAEMLKVHVLDQVG